MLPTLGRFLWGTGPRAGDRASWGFVTRLDFKIPLKVSCHFLPYRVEDSRVCEEAGFHLVVGECLTQKLPRGAPVPKLPACGCGSFSEAPDTIFAILMDQELSKFYTEMFFKM